MHEVLAVGVISHSLKDDGGKTGCRGVAVLSILLRPVSDFRRRRIDKTEDFIDIRSVGILSITISRSIPYVRL